MTLSEINNNTYIVMLINIKEGIIMAFEFMKSLKEIFGNEASRKAVTSIAANTAALAVFTGVLINTAPSASTGLLLAAATATYAAGMTYLSCRRGACGNTPSL